MATEPTTDIEPKQIKMEETKGVAFPGDATRIKHKKRRIRKTRTTTGWVIDKALKLSVWYIIYLVAFACPATEQELTASSSAICKPYLQLRHHLQPHLQPVYEQYVAPYAAKAQPYISQLDAKVYQPGLSAYKQHGAPVVAKAQEVGLAQWEKQVKPQIAAARQQVETHVSTLVGPHVKKVQDIIQPQVNSLRTSVHDLWELELEPVYRRTAPYAEKLYKHGNEFALKTALPQAQYASSAAYAFWIRQIWPKLRILYGENVEPQLMRITERLGRYKDEKKVEADVKSVEISASITSLTSSATSVVASGTPAASASTQEQFLADLESWKFACSTAAGEGAEHLKERIAEVSAHQISSQAEGVGSARVTQLEQTVEGAISSVKARILAIVAGIPEENAEDRDYDDANESLSIAIKNAGQSVKKYAQAVREWRQRYNAETTALVDQALTSTLETIDNIRELRLTEIGRKYASSSLPHKEWAKYNDLKKATQDWRDDVKLVVEKSEPIAKADEAGKAIEGQGMSIAADAAKELGRLKEVGKWKIESTDATDDFESKTLPPMRKVKEVLQAPMDAISDAIFGEETPALESATDAGKKYISEAVLGTPSGVADTLTDATSSIASVYSSVLGSEDTIVPPVSQISDTVASAAEIVTSTLAYADEAAGSAVSEAQESVASVAQDASEAAAEYYDEASHAVQDTVHTATAVAAEHVAAASEAAGEYINAASDVIDQATSSVQSATSKVWGGVAAQAVPSSSGPILDDVLEDVQDNAEIVSSYISEQIASMTNAVGSAAGTPAKASFDSISSMASERYEAAVSAASSAMYGEAQGQYQAAISAASKAIYGGPLDQASASAADIASIASLKYSEAVSQASTHWALAKSGISVAISGTPKPIHEQMYSSAESAYSDAMLAASVRLSEAVSIVPTASAASVYSSISAMASSQLSQALKTASAQYQSAKIAVGAEPTPAHQAYLANAQQAYYQGMGVAYDQYSSFVDAAKGAVGVTTPGYLEAASSSYASAVSVASSNLAALGSSYPTALSGFSAQYDSIVSAASSQLVAASSQASAAVYGTPQQPLEAAAPVATDIASQASANWNALLAKASSQVYGTPVPFTASVYTQAGSLAAQATSAAGVQYDAVASLFSELVSGRDADFTDSAMSRLSSAYYTGMPNVASVASSYASEAYESASSVVTSVFTPPPAIEIALQSVTEQLNALVDAASVQAYGSSTGYVESMTSAAASAYSGAASKASEAVYGSQTGYAEAASASFVDLAGSASKAISEALYGTQTGSIDAATSAAADTYSAVTSAVGEQAAAAASAISSAVYGPEQGAMESAQSRIAEAVESARSQIAAYAAGASGAAESIAIDAASAAASATQRLKDEL